MSQAWTSILLSNPQAILERIADFKDRLDQVAETIQADNEEALWSFFHEGRKHRKEMQIHQRAGRDSAYDLFIDVPDQGRCDPRNLTTLTRDFLGQYSHQ